MQIDAELLKRHRPPASELRTAPGCYTNWLGLTTDASLFPAAESLRNAVRAELPIGDDGVYGGYLEYASLLTAVEATPDRSGFTAVEMGAGWGPWISAVGTVCRRLAFREVTLVGVEADRGRCELMREHLARNNLAVRCIHGAAWKEDTTLWFPVIDPRTDHGAAVRTASAVARQPDYRGPDYRGKVHSYVTVPAYSLRTICRGLARIDYMHLDIQGAEWDVAQSDPEFLNRHVRFLFIGTHSRPVEGRLIEFFFAQRWDLLAQRPCHFIYDLAKPTLEGMGHTDGDLFLRNPRLG